MGEFQTVSRRQKGRRKNKPCSTPSLPHSCNQLITQVEFDEHRCRQQITDCKHELLTSEFWTDLRNLLSNAAEYEDGRSDLRDNSVNFKDKQTNIAYKEIVVYGIGSLTNSSIARYQFALVILLMEMLGCECFLYDPVLTTGENALIESHNIHIIDHNEECKRKVMKTDEEERKIVTESEVSANNTNDEFKDKPQSDLPEKECERKIENRGQKTLFVMLHCGRAMYNNLLWANWSPSSLLNVVILGNCFSSYEDRVVPRELAATSWYLKEMIGYALEHKVDNSFHHDDIFNDTAVHTFPRRVLEVCPDELWSHHDEPLCESDVEIVRKKVPQ